MSALIRVTTGIVAQHSRVGFARAFGQFGEVVHAHKPPFSGLAGEDFVNVRFASQDAADRAYAALKAGTVVVDGHPVGTGPVPGGGGGGGKPKGFGRSSLEDSRGGGGYGGGYTHGGAGNNGYRERGSARWQKSRSRSRGKDGQGGSRDFAPRAAGVHFPSRNDPKSPSPRRLARESGLKPRTDRGRSPRAREQERRRFVDGPALPALTYKERTPSPDPPGPERILTLVKNPFYRGYDND